METDDESVNGYGLYSLRWHRLGSREARHMRAGSRRWKHESLLRISSQPEGIDAWAQALYQRFGGPIAVALELKQRADRLGTAEVRFLCALSGQSIDAGKIP